MSTDQLREIAASGAFRGQQVTQAVEDKVASKFWIYLGAIIAIGAAVRLLLFYGMFGSDDLVYFGRAQEIAHGHWASGNYIGAIRYGVNIPIAATIALFGSSVWSAAVIPVLCSLAEIAMVGILVRPYWGESAALSAATVLCFIPLHIRLATLVHADPLLAFAITLTFVLFWKAECTGRRWLYFASGLAAGYAYWVKEASVLFLLAFVVYAIVARRWSALWFYAVAGAAIAFLLNCALMAAISGDPFHVLLVARSTVKSGWTTQSVHGEPLFYLRYLFLDIRHTWLAGYLAAFGGLCLVIARRTFSEGGHKLAVFVAVWLVGLFASFSFVPVSLSPLHFVMKQTNYMTIFLAPLAVLGGYGLSRLTPGLRVPFICVYAISGFTLAALGQQDARAYIANAQAAENYASKHPNDVVYGTEWETRISEFHALLRSPVSKPRIYRLSDLHPLPGTSSNHKLVIIIDRETLGRTRAEVRLSRALACWAHSGSLAPIGYGLGAAITQAIVWSAHLVPDNLGNRLSRPFEQLLQPAPADVYVAPAGDPLCDDKFRGTKVMRTDGNSRTRPPS